MDYFLCDSWGGSPHDAKKTVSNTEDDLMCWAAAASNVLAWTKWGFPPGQVFNDETSIFKYFQDHWADRVGYPNKAWEWWFNGEDMNDVDVSGGGFWNLPEYSFETYYHDQYDRTKSLLAIDEFFHEGYGVVLELISQNGGHFITCWGYEQNDEGRYIGIYTTDSDDPSQGLRYYEVNQDISGQDEWANYKDWWYLTYYKNSTRFLLSTVYALKKKRPSAPTNFKIV
jgi:Mac 1